MPLLEDGSWVMDESNFATLAAQYVRTFAYDEAEHPRDKDGKWAVKGATPGAGRSITQDQFDDANDQLVQTYKAWLKEQDLPNVSPEFLLEENKTKGWLTNGQRTVLEAFVAQWDALIALPIDKSQQTLEEKLGHPSVEAQGKYYGTQGETQSQAQARLQEEFRTWADAHNFRDYPDPEHIIGAMKGEGATLEVSDEQKAWLQQHQRDWEATYRLPQGTGAYYLTPEENAVVVHYTENGYHQMNRLAAGEPSVLPLDEAQRAREVRNVALLESAIEKSPPLPLDTILYRGVSNADFKALVPQLPGSTVSAQRFLSTSARKQVAEHWGGDVIFAIAIPAGTKALDVDETFGRRGSEREFILSSKTNLKIEGFTKETNSAGGERYLVQAKVVGP